MKVIQRTQAGLAAVVACLAAGSALAAEQKVNVELPTNVQSIALPNGDSVEVSTGVKVQVVERKAQEKPKAARRTAIFVDNRAGAQLNETVLRLEDHVAARAGGDKFEIISKEDVAKAVKVYPENTGAVAAERNTLGTREDRKLADDTSALRLGQNIGADYVLMVALDSFDAESKRFKTADIDVLNKVYTLRGTYKLLDGVTGGTLGGTPVRASKTVRESANISIENTDLTADLVEKLADQIAQDMLKKADQFREASAVGDIPVTIRCNARDLQGNEISLTDVGVTEDNRVVKGKDPQPLQVVATIAFDGMVMGSTPAVVKVKPGPHKLRLTRPGFDDAEMTVKAAEGMDLTVTMQMSNEGFARWLQIRDALNALDISRKMTDAEAERIRGIAQMFRQSGYRIDHRSNVKVDSKSDVKSDVKVDAKELPDVNMTYKSLF